MKLFWYVALIASGFGAFFGFLFTAMALLDYTLPKTDAFEGAGVGVALLALFYIVLMARWRWYLNNAIYHSWRGIIEAIQGSLGRLVLTNAEIEELRAFSQDHGFVDAPLYEIYEWARARRSESPEAELEFRWVAELICRFLTNVHHVSSHTILADYQPESFRGGRILAAGWCIGALGLVVWATTNQGDGVARLLAGTIGAWAVMIGVGLLQRWRWALWQALTALAALEVSTWYVMVSGRADSGFWVLALYLPLFSGIYLYRRRHWFTAL